MKFLKTSVFLFYFSANAQVVELDIIAQIESTNDSLAYNPKEQSTGLYQIRPICLQDFVERTGITYTMADMFYASKNREVAAWYLYKRIPQMLKFYGYRVTLNNTIIAYNAGIEYLVEEKPIPENTLNYIYKYKRLRDGR